MACPWCNRARWQRTVPCGPASFGRSSHRECGDPGGHVSEAGACQVLRPGRGPARSEALPVRPPRSGTEQRSRRGGDRLEGLEVGHYKPRDSVEQNGHGIRTFIRRGQILLAIAVEISYRNEPGEHPPSRRKRRGRCHHPVNLVVVRPCRFWSSPNDSLVVVLITIRHAT